MIPFRLSDMEFNCRVFFRDFICKITCCARESLQRMKSSELQKESVTENDRDTERKRSDIKSREVSAMFQRKSI